MGEFADAATSAASQPAAATVAERSGNNNTGAVNSSAPATDVAVEKGVVGLK
jgi:hypothetical protein